MSPVTLPGDLVSPVAGALLRRGSCVLIPAEDDRNELRPALVRVSESTYTGIIDGDGTTQIMGSQYVLLDLNDPAGRDRAARWLAEHHGLTVGATAPTWQRVYPFLWGLSADRQITFSHRVGNAPSIYVPAICGIRDPAEALRLACLAAVGRLEQA